jgi:hypothetical protein
MEYGFGGGDECVGKTGIFSTFPQQSLYFFFLKKIYVDFLKIRSS